jgi:hypothetical protein
MAAPCYIAWNASTANLSSAISGTSLSTTTPTTLLQLKTGANKVRLIEVGWSFSTTPSAPVRMEVFEAGNSGFATVTSVTPTLYNDATGAASAAVSSTTATGYTATAEGTIPTSGCRLLAQSWDLGPWHSQAFPLGREPEIQSGYGLRIRATAPSSSTLVILCYAIWEE